MPKNNQSLISTLAVTVLACGLMAAVPAQSQTGSPTPAAKATTTTPAAKKATTTAKPAGTATTAKKASAAPGVVLKTQAEKNSYALGANIGSGIKGQSIKVNPELVAHGLKDALSGSKMALTEAEIKQALTDLQTSMRKKQEDESKMMGSKNKAEGEAFLAANKAKAGVVTLPSGLQYKIITAGTGPKPTTADTVECNYRGTLINGKEFDSSYARKETVKFPVSGVIKGWTEALQLMPVGSKWQLFIPASLAYGPGGNRGIEPESTLIFDVELVSIVAKEPKAEEKKMDEMKDMKDMKSDDMKKVDEKKPDMPKSDTPK